MGSLGGDGCCWGCFFEGRGKGRSGYFMKKIVGVCEVEFYLWMEKDDCVARGVFSSCDCTGGISTCVVRVGMCGLWTIMSIEIAKRGMIFEKTYAQIFYRLLYITFQTTHWTLPSSGQEKCRTNTGSGHDYPHWSETQLIPTPKKRLCSRRGDSSSSGRRGLSASRAIYGKEVSRSDQGSDTSLLRQMAHIEAHSVHTLIDEGLTERVSCRRGREWGSLLEKIENVCMRYVTWWRRRWLVGCDRRCVYIERSVCGKCDASLPIMQPRGTIGGYTRYERGLYARH